MAHVLAKKLREAVLQAAMSGKLTEQLSTDTPVEETLKQIAKEKDRLIKEKKIKKDKPLPEIDEDEVPFDIPESWQWVNIPSFANSYLGKTLNKSTDSGDVKPYLCSINVYWDGLDTKEIKNARFNANEQEKYRLRRGDLLVCEGGEVGRSIVWEFDEEMYYQNALHRVRCYGGVSPVYIKNVLHLYKMSGIIDNVSKGIGIKHLVQNSLFSLPIPFPPIEEQARIVAKVDELMAKIDEYEKLENQLVDLKKNFPGDMKAAVLQAAMQGKLTEQLESDSDVFEYMRNVLSLKSELIKKKEIKKDKTVDVADDETPFDIPDNWSWVKFGNIATLRPGKTPPRAEPIWWGKSDEIPWISIADMVNDGTVTKTKEFISKAGFEQKFNGAISPAGTMIMSFKLTIGRMSILGMDALHNEAIISIFPFIDEDKTFQKYLFKVLPYLTQYGDSKNAIKGNTLNADSLCNLYIPLPPIEEQRRIVEKLDQLLPLCKELEKEIA